MDDQPAAHDDPVERFLEGPLAVPVNEALRRTLLMQTTRLLPRQHRWRRGGYAAALVASYLLGLATVPLGQRTPQPAVKPAGLATRERGAQETAASVQASAAPPLERDPTVPAFVLERMAESAREERARLYRLAGDRYLQQGDLRSAVHCYGRFLDAGTEADWLVSKEDNWLLTHLKTARQEEKSYAKSAG